VVPPPRGGAHRAELRSHPLRLISVHLGEGRREGHRARLRGRHHACVQVEGKDRRNQGPAAVAQRFKLRDLGPTSFLLGVQIDRERSARTLHLSQRQYTLDLLDRFGFADCSPVSTPLDPGSRLDMSQCPQTPEDNEFMRDKTSSCATSRT
jgi:hypothetical protein